MRSQGYENVGLIIQFPPPSPQIMAAFVVEIPPFCPCFGPEPELSYAYGRSVRSSIHLILHHKQENEKIR